MKCNEFIGLIPRFVDESLEQEYYENFVRHAGECSECRDELEIHYMIQVGLERIEEDSSKSFDIEGELRGQLQRYQRIANKRFKRSVYRQIIMIVAHLCIFISLFEVISAIV